MFLFLAFPVGAFIFFNSRNFYESSLKQSMQMLSRDVDFASIAKYEQIMSKQEVEKLGDMIEKLDGDSTKSDPSKQTSTPATSPGSIYSKVLLAKQK